MVHERAISYLMFLSVGASAPPCTSKPCVIVEECPSVFLPRTSDPRTRRCTRGEYLVRYTASSTAESPPPTTASGSSCARIVRQREREGQCSSWRIVREA